MRDSDEDSDWSERDGDEAPDGRANIAAFRSGGHRLDSLDATRAEREPRPRSSIG